MTRTPTPHADIREAPVRTERWLYQRDDSDEEIYYAIHDRQTFRFIANVYGSERDASLAASAPDMLDVLKTTRSNIVSLRDAGLPGPLTEWLRVVDETIAKATTP